MREIRATTASVAVATCLAAGPVEAQHGAPADGEWRSYAGDSGSTKYSPLDQITADNFGDLEVRWHWESVDSHLVHATPAGDSLVAADTLFDILQAEEPDPVHEPVFTVYAARPVAGQPVLERFRLANPLEGGSADVLDQRVDAPDDLPVRILPVQVVLPGVPGEDELHSRSLRSTPPPAAISSTDSKRRRAFAGLRSR